MAPSHLFSPVFLRLGGALVTALALGHTAAAQTSNQTANWPDRAIRIISAYGPGAAPDIGLRRISVDLAKALGQPVIIDPRPGAGGRIAAAEAAKAAPDGYTFAFSDSGPIVVLPATGAKLGYNVEKDFVPVVRMAHSFPYLVVPTGSAAQNVGDLKNLGRTPTFGLSGLGTYPHVICLMAAQAAGFACNPIPYSKGTSAALMDVAAGTIDLGIGWGAEMQGLIEGRKIRILATMAPRRTTPYPNVPTVAEFFPAAESLAVFTGIFAPSGTPAPVVERLRAEVNKVMLSGAFRAWVESSGGDVNTIETLEGTGFAQFLDKQRIVIKAIADAYGLKSE